MKQYNGKDIISAINGNTSDDILKKYTSHIRFKQLKKRVDFEELHTLDDILNHWYLKNYIKQFVNHAIENNIHDLYLTGSWVRGTYRHPDKIETIDKVNFAKEIGRNEISDIDFWTKETSREKFYEVFRSFSEKLGVHISWVAWPGPGILCTTNENPKLIKQVGCNNEGIISNNYKRVF